MKFCIKDTTKVFKGKSHSHHGNANGQLQTKMTKLLLNKWGESHYTACKESRECLFSPQVLLAQYFTTSLSFWLNLQTFIFQCETLYLGLCGLCIFSIPTTFEIQFFQSIRFLSIWWKYTKIGILFTFCNIWIVGTEFAGQDETRTTFFLLLSPVALQRICLWFSEPFLVKGVQRQRQDDRPRGRIHFHFTSHLYTTQCR